MRVVFKKGEHVLLSTKHLFQNNSHVSYFAVVLHCDQLWQLCMALLVAFIQLLDLYCFFSMVHSFKLNNVQLSVTYTLSLKENKSSFPPNSFRLLGQILVVLVGKKERRKECFICDPHTYFLSCRLATTVQGSWSNLVEVVKD